MSLGTELAELQDRLATTWLDSSLDGPQQVYAEVEKMDRLTLERLAMANLFKRATELSNTPR